MNTHRQELGFTVVEILIALSIISLVVATLISAFDFTRIVLISTQSDQRYLEQVELLRRVLGEALAQVMHSERTPARMSGNDRTLVVATSPPRLLSFLDAPVQLSLHAGRDGDGLHASWKAESTANSSIDHRIVGAHYRARFSYLTADAAWANLWADQARLPAAVRVELFRSIETRSRLELILPVRAVANAICAVEPMAASCGRLR